MPRKLICRWCGEKSPRPEMHKVTQGKVNKYYHEKDCYEEFLAEEEFKKEEAIKKDSLYRTVMKIYDAKALPNTFYMQIEGLRHGNKVFKKQNIGKRYREGYDYDLIEEAYKESVDAIEWSMKNKPFQNLSNALNYGLSIVINNIYGVEKRRDSVRQRDDMAKISENTKMDEPDEMFDDFVPSYKKKDNPKDDILDILD